MNKQRLIELAMLAWKRLQALPLSTQQSKVIGFVTVGIVMALMLWVASRKDPTAPVVIDGTLVVQAMGKFTNLLEVYECPTNVGCVVMRFVRDGKTNEAHFIQ